MKKIFILIPLFGLLAGAIFSSYSSGPAFADGLERSGASGGTPGCGGGGCHSTGSSAAILPMNISLVSGSTPVTSYTPGMSYNIVITCTYTPVVAATLPKFGFQMGAMKGISTSVNAGTWGTLPASTHMTTALGANVVEHSAPLPPFAGTGAAGTIYAVSVPWTAPAAGTGNVKLYGVINAVDGFGSANNADKWSNTSATIAEATTTAVGVIAGTQSVCTGATTTLSCTPAGGTWSSSTPAVATVGATGIVNAVSAGTSTITYNAGTAGTATAVVTVNAAPTAITGTASACTGATTTLASTPAGGTWASGTTAVATVNSATGMVTGVAAGTTIITYATTTGCTSTRIVTINASGAAPINGVSTVCVGTIIHQTNLTTGGTWTSSTPAKATVGATTGIVTGVAVGTTTISYTATNSCGTSTATKMVNVLAAGSCTTGVMPAPAATAAVLSVYPNPNNGSFTLKMQAELTEEAHVIICGISGEKVKEFTTTTNATVDMNLPRIAGMYVVSVTTAQGNYVTRLLIQ